MAAETYFTGKPCKRGHISERYMASKGCVECTKENRSQQWQREKIANRQRAQRSSQNQKPLAAKTGRRNIDYSDLIKPSVVMEAPESVEDFIRRGGVIITVRPGESGIKKVDHVKAGLC